MLNKKETLQVFKRKKERIGGNEEDVGGGRELGREDQVDLSKVPNP